MARTLILLFLSLLSHLAWATTTHRDLLVHFEKDRSVLTPEATAALDAFIASIDLSGDYSLDIHGHTDSDGSQAYNLALSNARAEAVEDYLVAHGVDPALVTVERSGERDPLASNSNDAGMAENRRVRIAFTQHRFADLDELRAELASGSVQHFIVDPGKDQLVEGANGARLLLLANTLVGTDGKAANGPVDLTLTEALGLEAMLAHQLSTRSNDRLLETAGMVKVEAVDTDGKPLQLRTGSTMQVALPKGTDQPGMQLFTSATGTDWKATGQTPVTPRNTTSTIWSEMVVQVPVLPKPGYPPFEYPIYKEDRTGKPMRPLDPWLPDAPARPREESYTAHAAWWQAPWRGRLEAEAEQRYARALQVHERRMQKYQERVERYESDCAAMPERLARYATAQAAWDQRKQEEYDTWWTTLFEPARSRHDSTYADAIAAYQVTMKTYRQRYDSVMASWRAERTACLAEYAATAERNGTADLGGLRAYVFNASQLGWINCDRFYDVPEQQKYDAVVADNDRLDEQVFLVFTDINSLVAMHRPAGGRCYAFAGVPRTQPAEVIAFQVKDGRPMLCRKAVRPGEVPTLEYERSSFMAIQRVLQELAGQPS